MDTPHPQAVVPPQVTQQPGLGAIGSPRDWSLEDTSCTRSSAELRQPTLREMVVSTSKRRSIDPLR